MKTIVLCAKCKQELHIVDVRLAWTINEVEIKVEICQNSDCYEGDAVADNCPECEDLKLWQKRAEVAEQKLETIKSFFVSEKPLSTEKEEESGVNVLQPTPDVVSTGGAIIPGIKEGSADGVKAEYGLTKG